MAFSEVGKKKLAGHAVFLILDIICLGLAVKVNKFHDFFYYADIFPLGLSIVTLILISVMLILDVSLARSWTAFPPFEIIIFVLLSIFWLSFNAFSTSRWMHIPMACSSLPSEYRVWCRDTNALKAFVWLTFVVCLLITLLTLTYTLRQYTSGHKHVLTTPLSRYRPKLNPVSHHRSAYSVASGFSDFFPTAQRVGGADPFERAPTPVEVVSSHGHGHGHSPSGNHGHGHGHGYGHGYGGGQQMSEKQPPQANEPYGRTFEKVQGW